MNNKNCSHHSHDFSVEIPDVFSADIFQIDAKYLDFIGGGVGPVDPI